MFLGAIDDQHLVEILAVNIWNFPSALLLNLWTLYTLTSHLFNPRWHFVPTNVAGKPPQEVRWDSHWYMNVLGWHSEHYRLRQQGDFLSVCNNEDALGICFFRGPSGLEMGAFLLGLDISLSCMCSLHFCVFTFSILIKDKSNWLRAHQSGLILSSTALQTPPHSEFVRNRLST